MNNNKKMNKKSVVISLHGGLGDQLYQYSFGCYLKKNFGYNLIFDTSFYKSRKNKNNFKLGIKNLLKKEKHKVEEKIFLFGYTFLSKLRYLSSINNKLNNLLFNLLFKENINNFVYEDWRSCAPLKINKYKNYNTFYFGYWHYKKTILSNKKKILSFLIYNNLNDKKTSLFIKNKIKKNTCMIHIRGGDYLEKKFKNFYVCNEKYYIQAIKLLKVRIKNPKFHIFTNDVVYAKKIIKKINIEKNSYFVCKNKFSVEQEFVLQTLYENAIVNNSNFSYLPSLLSSKRNITISPKKLFKDTILPVGLKLKRIIYI